MSVRRSLYVCVTERLILCPGESPMTFESLAAVVDPVRIALCICAGAHNRGARLRSRTCGHLARYENKDGLLRVVSDLFVCCRRMMPGERGEIQLATSAGA